ncbi:MAG: hypothetical protein WA924_15395 [Burkholderiaceae bacterium]
MEPTVWLEAHVPGFRELPARDREAIASFALLWSLFEARALAASASAREILALSHEWAARGVLGHEFFDRVLEYFCNRYFPGEQRSDHFRHLNLCGNDNPALVEAVLRRQNDDPADRVAVALIVIYRFRNNLVHGTKWAYCIAGQLENFTMANDALMLVLERNDA